MLQVKWSDRPLSHYSDIEEVQSSILETFADPSQYGVSVTVSNVQGESMFFDSTEGLRLKDLKEKVSRLEDLV